MTIDREELRRLCEAATPGPWRLHDMEHATIVAGTKPGLAISRFDAKSRADATNGANAAFAIAARTAIPALLDALEAAEARERRLRRVVTKCMDRFGEYEQGHINAGKFDKAARNGEMRQMCRDVLAETAP